MASDINLFGEVNFRNQKKRFGIKADDRRRHMYVIGKTGMGKTTLLENMVVNDIISGRGVGVIDPHGDFAEKMLDYVPEERLKDVIYFNPSDMNYPIAFNPLEQVSTEFSHLVASGIMGVFKKIWPDVWSARMEYILNNTLLALLEYPGSTLLGIMRMLADKDYRKKVVDNLKDPVIKGFWVNEFARYSQKFETEATAAIQNKVGQFVSNPLIRNILGQATSAMDMRKIIDGQKIFIVNLSKGRIGEDNSALLGAMMITKLQLAAMSRVDIPEEERKDFYLYVDEFQNFATESFANILSEARKYRLALILAHQYIKQLEEEVADAVFGNMGTLVTFRVGAEDAEFLEKEFEPDFMATDIVNLGKYDIYSKLMIDGVASRPFSAKTLPPPPKQTVSLREGIIENSRLQYATPKSVVEEKIAEEWLTVGAEAMGEKIARRGEESLSRALGGGGDGYGGYRDRGPRQEFSERPRYPRPLGPRPTGPGERPRYAGGASPPRPYAPQSGPPPGEARPMGGPPQARPSPQSVPKPPSPAPKPEASKSDAVMEDLRKVIKESLEKNKEEEKKKQAQTEPAPELTIMTHEELMDEEENV